MKNRQVIFIMTDTQRKDMIDAYSGKGLFTPNLDKLYRKGIAFEQAHCVQPVCGPARSAIWTGKAPHSNGCIANGAPLGENVKTLAERLSEAGITVAHIGKWHLDGGDYFGNGVAPCGFLPEYWYDMRNYLNELTEEERKISRMENAPDIYEIREEFTFGYRCALRAEKYLKKHGSENMMLAVSFDEPHEPYLCPKKWQDFYENYMFPVGENLFDDLRDKPEHQKIWKEKYLNELYEKNGMVSSKKYFGCNSFIDKQIGRVLEAVEKYCSNPFIIYTSDHGTMLFSHGLKSKGPAMYKEITNVPFIISGEGIPCGQVCRVPVSHVDIFPTICEIFQVPQSVMIEGKSIIPFLKNSANYTKRNIFMEWTRYEIDHDGFMGYQPIRCVFDGKYKLVINLNTTDELYDLEKDPEEIINLIENEKYTEIRNNLLKQLIDNMNRTRDPFRGYYWERRTWNNTIKATYDYTGYTRQSEELGFPHQLDYDTGLPYNQRERIKK